MLKNWKKRILILIILITITNATGCWQEQDIQKRSIVSAVGLDLAPGNRVEVTLQIVRTEAAAEASEGGTTEGAVWVHSTTGDTVVEAIRNHLKSVNRKPFFGHNQIIVIGEGLAKNGIQDVVDLFERDPDTKFTPIVLIAKGTTAKTILNISSELEPVPSSHIKDIVENYPQNSVIQHVLFLDLLQQLNNKGHQLTTGVISFSTNNPSNKPSVNHIEVEGAATFKGDRLIGWLTPEQTAGLQYLENEVKSGIINVAVPNEKNKKAAIERVNSFCKINPVLEGDKLKIIVDIKAKGNLGGQQGSINLATPEMLAILEANCESAIKEKVNKTINIAQKELRSDILGFGEVVRRNQLKTWRVVQKDWEDIFPTIPVEVNVEFQILRTGLISEPVKVH